MREGEKRRDIDPPFSPLSLFFLLLLSCMSVGSFVFEKIVHHGMSCSLRCNDSALERLDFSKFSNSSRENVFIKSYLANLSHSLFCLVSMSPARFGRRKKEKRKVEKRR